eukprot:12983216-Ditylum_brightwellii.AAC.1
MNANNVTNYSFGGCFCCRWWQSFCQPTYTLEGDGPLILTGHLVRTHITLIILELGNDDNVPMTEIACCKAAQMVAALNDPITSSLNKAKDDVIKVKTETLLANAEVVKAQAYLDAYQSVRHANPNTGRNAQTRKHTQTPMGEEYNNSAVSTKEKELIDAVKGASDELYSKKLKQEETEHILREWEDKSNKLEAPEGLEIEEDFLIYARDNEEDVPEPSLYPNQEKKCHSRKKKEKIYKLDLETDGGSIIVDYTAADHINVDINIALSREHTGYESWKDDPGECARHIYNW